MRKGSLLLMVALLATVGIEAQSPRETNERASPLLPLLSRFEDPSVPKMSPEETETPPLPDVPQIASRLPGKGMAQHPMLVLGEGYNKLLLVNHGRITWTYSTGPGWEYDDAWMLSNGNVLFTRMQYIAEVSPDKKVVWRYDAPEGSEIHGCQPIGLQKVLFVINGLPPHLLVVNIRTRSVEVDHILPAPSTTDRRTVHAQFRRVRYTSAGTYLIPFLEMNRVVEYDKNFKEVWSVAIPTPWAAIRLKNGNTLITDEHDVLTREVDPSGKTVWEIAKSDIPEAYRYSDAQSVTRLENGNTIICSRGGEAHGPQMVEVTSDKKVVWVLHDWQHFGPVTAVQVLDESGFPEVPGDSQH